MVHEVKCPDCGGTVEIEDLFETQYFEDAYYDYAMGKCLKCGKRYKWIDAFKYVATQEMELVADE